MTKVAFVCHPYHRGGVTRWMVDSFSSFCRTNGQENFYFISFIPDPASVLRQSRAGVVSLIEEDFQSSVYTEKAGDSFFLGTLEYRAYQYYRLLRKHVPPGVSVIPSDDEACWIACAMVAKINPLVAVIHSYGDQGYFDLLKRYQSSVSLIVSVSTSVAKAVEERISFHRAITHVIVPCGIVLPKAMGAESRLNQVVWLGRLEESSKRVSDIPKICERLLIADPNICVKVIGDGEMSSFLAREKAAKSLSNLELLGWNSSEEIYSQLHRSKALLITSNYEGMPVAMMEAFAQGCVLVSSRVSGVIDIEGLSESRGIVSVFEIGDVQKAAQLIVNVVQNYSSSMEEQARSLAATFFDIQKTNKKLMEAIAQDPAQNVCVSFSLPLRKVFFSYPLWLARRVKIFLLQN